MAINIKTAPKEAAVSSTPSWAKKGTAALQELDKYEKEIALNSEQKNKMWRFHIKEGEEAQITFVDGDIDAEGNVNFLMFYEHNLMLNNKWGNYFVCTKDAEPPCPICAADDTPSFVGAFTVIDRREYVTKDGKVYKDQARLFVAKRDTIKYLQKIGVKRGGLAGCTFDVMRTGDKSPAVGSQFDFVEKQSIEDLQALFQRKNADSGKMETYFVPADYSKEITYRSPDELRTAIPSLAVSSGGNAPVGKVTKEQMTALETEL